MIRRPPRSTLFPLHDALPISVDGYDPDVPSVELANENLSGSGVEDRVRFHATDGREARSGEGYDLVRSEEHTSELQSRQYLVCRLLLEKKKGTVSHQPLDLRA